MKREHLRKGDIVEVDGQRYKVHTYNGNFKKLLALETKVADRDLDVDEPFTPVTLVPPQTFVNDYMLRVGDVIEASIAGGVEIGKVVTTGKYYAEFYGTRHDLSRLTWRCLKRVEDVIEDMVPKASHIEPIIWAGPPAQSVGEIRVAHAKSFFDEAVDIAKERGRAALQRTLLAWPTQKDLHVRVVGDHTTKQSHVEFWFV